MTVRHYTNIILSAPFAIDLDEYNADEICIRFPEKNILGPSVLSIYLPRGIDDKNADKIRQIAKLLQEIGKAAP